MNGFSFEEFLKVFEEDEPTEIITVGSRKTTTADSRRKEAAKVAHRNLERYSAIWYMDKLSERELGRIRKGTFNARIFSEDGYHGRNAGEDRRIKSERSKKEEMKAALADFMAPDFDYEEADDEAPTVEDLLTYAKVCQWFNK